MGAVARGMVRRRFLKTLGSVVAGSAVGRSTFGAARLLAGTGGSATPNIVFILTDDLGWTGLSARMHDVITDSKSDFYQTPHLASLAAQGMRFSQAYAPSPVCYPTWGL